ncbi:ephrin-B3-like [Acropora muricata]|uniref:ephrin-B3-like n=1 Tax=Acropora muricata TaxID=159855 RepID=UPI0034E5FCBA
MNTFGVLIIFGLASVYGRDVYTSINWDPRNPIFKADGKNCGPGPRQLKVRLNSQVYLVCPNLATVLHPRGTDVQTSDMWENIWLLKNKTAFDDCDVSQLPDAQRSKDLHPCDNPTGLDFLSLLFLEHAAGRDDRTFDEGRTYYVMATSDGTQSSVNDLSGGHCNDTSNNVDMRIEVYVCNKTGDRICDSTNVGVLTCPLPTTTAPTTTTTTAPHTASPYTNVTHGTDPRNNTTVPIMTNRSVAPSKSSGKEENPTKTTTSTTKTTTKTEESETENSVSAQKQGERIGENHEVVELQNSRFRWMVIAITVSCIAVIVIVIFTVYCCSGKKKCPAVFPTVKETPKPGLGMSNIGYVTDTMTRRSVYEAANQPSSQKFNHVTIETTSFN